LALTAKLSALLLIPVTGLLALLESRHHADCRLQIADCRLQIADCKKRIATRGLRLPARGKLAAGHLPLVIGHWSLFIVHWALVILLAGLVVWASYRFEVRAWPGTTLPLPATTYLLNVRTLIGHADRGHGAFLMGQVSIHGWWYYFPVAFLLKTPLPTLLFLGVAAWDTVRRARWREEAPLLFFPAAYFGFALASSLNIGFRYILPIVPFIITYAAKVAGLTWLRPTWLRRYALPVLMVLYAGTSLRLHPHYLAYFNLLAGGPEGGYRYLVDSNLDWGQDLKLLKAYLDEQGVDEVWLGYLGTADPAYYGIRYRSLFVPGTSRPAEGFFPINPAPGWYAVSATVLQGAYSPEPDLFDWFRRHEPMARIGYSIFVYRVEPDPDPASWLGFCYTPEPVMRDAEISRRFGRDDLRVVGFDCGQTWVYPAGGGPGWYLVPAANDGPGTLTERSLGDGQVIYRERGLRDAPAYTVYRWRGAAAPEELVPAQEANLVCQADLVCKANLVRKAWASPALAPTEADSLTALPVPADLGGQVSFLGYGLSSEQIAPGDEMVLTTAWQVTARPEAPPLSIFAHLVGPTGAVSVGDGLGFPAIQWVPGDVFIQRNRLLIPAEAPPGRYWVQVGLYSLATDERLPVRKASKPVADRLLLAPVTVGD
jgi:hypothetical protein